MRSNFFFDENVFHTIINDQKTYKVLYEIIFSKKYDIGILNNEYEKIISYKDSKNDFLNSTIAKLTLNNPLYSSDWKQNILQNELDFIIENNSSIFITKDSVFVPNELREKYGIAIYSLTDEIEELSDFINHSFKISISKNDSINFEELLNQLSNFNSIIISDPYIFKNERINGGNLKNFIKELLKKCKSQSIEMQISIITEIKKIYDNDSDSEKEMKEKSNSLIVESIERFVSDDIFNNINIQVFTLTKKLHKRIIITNYSYLWSDKGFANLRNNEKNDFHIRSRNGNDNPDKHNYSEFAITDLNEIQELINTSKDYKPIGDQFENRLFNVLKPNNTTIRKFKNLKSPLFLVSTKKAKFHGTLQTM